ncbi:type II secretion system protein N [Aliiglaciecola litoralis]|uniref:Type II secretion system protein N n=1 Tax=Aliiglaciecola litoralis TaxID=582857 RepID=A0ABP3WQX5_9ALTE
MSRIVKWSLLGLLAYLVFLIVKLPASQVVHRINHSNEVVISDVRGTIWNATASLLIVNNVAIERVSWKTSFWSLLVGNVTLDIKGGNLRASDKVSVQGPVTISLFDPTHIRASDLNIYVPANMVIAQVTLPVTVDAGGRFKIQIKELDYHQACVTLEGKGQWLNAGIEGLGEPLELGNFDADLSCIENDILVRIKPPNIFNLSADARVPMNLAVSVNGRFKPDDSLPKQVKDAANFFGRPDADGFYNIKL